MKGMNHGDRLKVRILNLVVKRRKTTFSKSSIWILALSLLTVRARMNHAMRLLCPP